MVQDRERYNGRPVRNHTAGSSGIARAKFKRRQTWRAREVQGRAPGQWVRGAKPPEAEDNFSNSVRDFGG